MWIRVTLDSYNGGQIAEICEVNNQRTEKNNAKAANLGFHKSADPNRVMEPGCYEMGVENDYNARRLNIVGSFSDFDYYTAHVDRVNIMLQTTKCDTVSPAGIQDGLRVDKYINFVWDPDFTFDNLLFKDPLSDGACWELILNSNTDDSHMDLYTPICHEFGHNFLGLVDIYGSLIPAKNALAVSSPGCVEFPFITPGDDVGSVAIGSSHRADYPDEYLVGYSSLMDSTHMWLDRMNAGIIQYRRQFRSYEQERQWGIYAPHGTDKNKIKFYDVHGGPLQNAEVYVYPIIHYPHTEDLEPNKYFPNQAKFTGLTAEITGIYTFPTITSNNWDDWTTTVVEGAEYCASPFDRHNGDNTDCDSFTVCPHNYVSAELLLIKIAGSNPINLVGGVTEYHILPLTELNNAFFKNGGDPDIEGTYYIHTSLDNQLYSGTPLMPDAPSTNARPVADLSTTLTTVPVNTSIVLNGSNSHDGDAGRTDPLWYWWRVPFESAGNILYVMHQTYGTQNTYTITNGFSVPGTYTCELYVFDGLKYSDKVQITITVTP